jgi:hypothetical protein
MRRKKRRRKLKARVNRFPLWSIICCRSSTDPQVVNHLDQMGRLECAAKWKWTAIYDRIGQGNDVEHWTDAAQHARNSGVPILAESLDRLMRSSDYTRYDQDAPLTDSDWARFNKVFDGVEIVYLNEGPSRSYQTKRGQQAKGNVGGRPKVSKKVGRPKGSRNVSQSILDQAKKMDEQGYSLNQQANEFGYPRCTIQGWRKRGYSRCMYLGRQ